MQVRWMIQVESEAPDKPAAGASCNGCGICCLSEPCPLGMLLSRRRHGACVAVHWQVDQMRYRCGAVGRWPRLDQLLLRWIGAGAGCDCELETLRQSDRQSPHD